LRTGSQLNSSFKQYYLARQHNHGTDK
jgi:hypothetical protein